MAARGVYFACTGFVFGRHGVVFGWTGIVFGCTGIVFGCRGLVSGLHRIHLLAPTERFTTTMTARAKLCIQALRTTGSYCDSGLSSRDHRRKEDQAKIKQLQTQGKKLAQKRDADGVEYCNSLSEEEQQILEDYDTDLLGQWSRALKKPRLGAFRI